jgi:hypothetical protein
MRSICLLFLAFTLIPSNAQIYNGDSLIKGEWILSGMRFTPVGFLKRDVYSKFKTSDLLEDSLIKLIISDNEIINIEYSRSRSDTQIYNYSYVNADGYLKMWYPKTRKRDRNRIYYGVRYADNKRMILHHQSSNSRDAMFSIQDLEYHFTKKLTTKVLSQIKIFGRTWYINEDSSFQSHIWGMDSIILQREPSYFSKTSKISSYGDTLSTSKKYHIINFDTENFSILDSISSETIKRDVPERPKGTPRFESYIYGKPNSQFLKFSIVFHNSLVEFIPLNSDLTTKFYSYTFENDKLVLTKQQN